MGVKSFGIKTDFIFEAAMTLSGQRSSTQKHIGILLIFFMKIAGKPTVMGDGSKTKMMSILFFTKNNDVIVAPITYDK